MVGESEGPGPEGSGGVFGLKGGEIGDFCGLMGGSGSAFARVSPTPGGGAKRAAQDLNPVPQKAPGGAGETGDKRASGGGSPSPSGKCGGGDSDLAAAKEGADLGGRMRSFLHGMAAPIEEAVVGGACEAHGAAPPSSPRQVPPTHNSDID